MTALLGVLLASLVGSVHCAGMCGPFVCVYAGLGAGQTNRWVHTAYHAGRLVSYVLLGAVAGALGRGADHLGALAGMSRTAAVLAGALMVVWGTTNILKAKGVILPWHGVTRSLRSPLGAILARLRNRPLLVRAGATGLFTTLLPCGWLYAFVAVAAGSGSALTGSGTMFFFWLGTVPALSVLGVVTQRLALRYGQRLPIAMACVVVLLGVLTIIGRVRLESPIRLPTAYARHAH